MICTAHIVIYLIVVNLSNSLSMWLFCHVKVSPYRILTLAFKRFHKLWDSFQFYRKILTFKWNVNEALKLLKTIPNLTMKRVTYTGNPNTCQVKQKHRILDRIAFHHQFSRALTIFERFWSSTFQWNSKQA